MKDLRKDLEKILLELLCKWDKGGLAEEEAEDKILSLFKQRMKEITPRKFNMETFTKTNPMYKSYKGFNVAIDQILKNIEKL